ncbi:MAG TPA: hypothetical protein VF160_16940 [Candidatus Dormibacteraeota bacterium]
MEDARRWGSIDSFVEWLQYRAPEEAFMAGADGELAARFYRRLAEWLFALALLGFWRLNRRDECAACAAALERVAPEHSVLEQLRRERPDIAGRMRTPHVSPRRRFPPLDPESRIVQLSGLLAQQLQRDDLEGFARACQDAGEDVLPLAVGLDD